MRKEISPNVVTLAVPAATPARKISTISAFCSSLSAAAATIASPAPTVVKWERILGEMQAEGAPLTVKELAIGGKELSKIGYRGEELGRELGELFRLAVLDGRKNDRDILLSLAARQRKGKEK